MILDQVVNLTACDTRIPDDIRGASAIQNSTYKALSCQVKAVLTPEVLALLVPLRSPA